MSSSSIKATTPLTHSAPSSPLFIQLTPTPLIPSAPSNFTTPAHLPYPFKKCANLSGWILRTFNTRDCITMLTLFKSIVLSRLDYGSQLWSLFLIKHITHLEKIQRSFTKHITGINDMPYHERLKSLGLYSLQRRRERYCIIYIWKIIEGVEAGHASFPMSI